MTASQLSFNGKLYATPGAKTKINASAFDAVKLGASGIVALLGTAEGGTPYNAIRDPENEIQKATNSGKVRSFFRSGDLREAGALMFTPAKDPEEIPAGAQQVVFVKVNPATRAETTFANAGGNALKLKSLDYGAFNNQIKVTIANASSGVGKLITVTLDETVESFDLLGGTAKFSLLHASGATKPTAVVADTSATQVNLRFTRTDDGQDTGVTQATGGASLEVVSSNAGDTTQVVTVYGLNASNVPQTQTVTLNGTTPVAVPGTWNLETAVTMSVVAAGTMTLRIAGAGATVVTLTAGQTNKGFIALDIPVDANSYNVRSDGATTRQLVVRGNTTAGGTFAERFVLSGTTPVATLLVTPFNKITSVEVLNVEAARDSIIKGSLVVASHANYPTLAKVRDRIKVLTDITFTDIAGNLGELTIPDLDYVTDENILSPTTGSFFAKLYDIVTTINAQSQLVIAERVSPGTGAPTNTTSPVFLAGAHEGDSLNPGVPTATFADWQAALDLLKQVYKNTIVPLTSDAAVHAAGDAHCAFMCGDGEQECDQVVGAAVDETLAQLKTRVLNLNSRHTRLCAQEIKVFGTDGEEAWKAPAFQAAIVAAMQAGTSIGNPLTNKLANVLAVRQNTAWNPKEDSEELILGGIHVMRLDPGVGFRVLRNITTYKKDANQVYTEASMNQSANRFAYEFRTRMNALIGKKGVVKTVNNAKAIADQVLDGLVRDEIIAEYDKPAFTLAADTLTVEVGAAIVSPVNFIPITINVRPFVFSL